MSSAKLFYEPGDIVTPRVPVGAVKRYDIGGSKEHCGPRVLPGERLTVLEPEAGLFDDLCLVEDAHGEQAAIEVRYLEEAQP